jgi:hypothetical protein
MEANAVTTTDELRERVALALGAPLIATGRVWPDYAAADRALATLGLDDLDAAVERLATFMSATEPYRHFHPENLKGHARRALEAALTPR